jgi:P4 family phage/plasmid primase-like protien
MGGYDPIAVAKKVHKKKFTDLYELGKITDYTSASEADLALCNYLAFYTGGNAKEMDMLFRQSKLYREKWEREDYRTSTIQKAIDGCHGQFHTAARQMPPYFYYNVKLGRIAINCPLLAKHIRENLKYMLVRDMTRGGTNLYVYENGVYKLYHDDMFRGIIKSYITAHDESLLNMNDVSEVFRQLITDLDFVDNSALNRDEGIVNFINGMLDLKTMRLLPHSPKYLSTIQIPCEWRGESLSTPVFDKFMSDLTGGRKDVEKLLLQYMGVCLSNIKGWRLKKALFLVGKGDTGKSQLKSLTERLLGKGNYIGIDLKELEARFGTSNIYMKRLAGSADMSFATLGEVKIFKKATRGDSLFAEFKGQNGFEFTYDGLLWFCMNKFPKFGGDNGEWVYSRIIIVECNNVIPLDEQDKQLQDKLYSEREGIVQKAIATLQEVIDDGYSFSEPTCVVSARNRYFNESNTVISFLEECTEKRPNGKILDKCTTGRIYNVYRAWCADNNNGYAKTAKEFRDELAEHFGVSFQDITVRRGNGGTFYRGFTLTAEAKSHYSKAYGYDIIELSGAVEQPNDSQVAEPFKIIT